MRCRRIGRLQYWSKRWRLRGVCFEEAGVLVGVFEGLGGGGDGAGAGVGEGPVAAATVRDAVGARAAAGAT
jgi:hypothetical protein